MSYDAKVYQVLIASPSDVAKEREIVRDVIHEWDYINAYDKKVVLLPVGWETHTSPEMGLRPQEAINQQLVKKCDLLVGVFWTRIGTPTGVSDSGTLEEIDEHIKAGKPVMLYFSSAPVRPESIDQEQYVKLISFKKECMQKGLVESYESLSEFQEKFRRQLALKLINSSYFQVNSNEIQDKTSDRKESSEFGSILKELTSEARELLVEAASSPDGSILKIKAGRGIIIQANKRQFVEENNPRSEAAWEYAIRILDNYFLIQDQGYKGEVYALTHLGYQIADVLKIEI